jgi:hypothetical protein
MLALDDTTLTLRGTSMSSIDISEAAISISRRHKRLAQHMRKLIQSVCQSTEEVKLLNDRILRSAEDASVFEATFELATLTLGDSDERDKWLEDWSEIVGLYPDNDEEDGSAETGETAEDESSE